MSMSRSSSYQHCLHILRMYDFSRYIACLFTPSAKREPLAALWAFDCEMARLAAQITQPLIGEIRLRWWCDEIEKIDKMANHFPKEPRIEQKGDEQNPLLSALQQTIIQFDLPKQILITAVEARIDLLYEPIFSTPQDIEHYAKQTASVFFQLACQILEQFAEPNSEKNTLEHEDLSKNRDSCSDLAKKICLYAGQVETLYHYWRWQLRQGCDAPTSSNMREAICYHYTLFANETANTPRTWRPAFLPLAPFRNCLHPTSKPDDFITSHSALQRLWRITSTALNGKFI